MARMVTAAMRSPAFRMDSAFDPRLGPFDPRPGPLDPDSPGFRKKRSQIPSVADKAPRTRGSQSPIPSTSMGGAIKPGPLAERATTPAVATTNMATGREEAQV